MTSIFLFHRDLRIKDNSALNLLNQHSKQIVPLFVFTPEQVTTNPYKSDNSIQFMVESLENLFVETNKKLKICYGKLIKVLEYIFKNNDIKFIGFNLDYTPYAKERTIKVLRLCEKYDVTPIIAEDYSLVEMDQIRDGSYFSVFNAFYQKISKIKIDKPKYSKVSFTSNIGISKKYLKTISFGNSLYRENSYIAQSGGRKNGLLQLKRLYKQKNYAKTRNNPNYPTSLLSSHIKFGTVSIREVYYAMKKYSKSQELIRQLIWHDFYAQLVYYLPEEKTFGGGNFKNKKIKWVTDRYLLNAWKKGMTGFPIIDAAMRQLNETGWMHNRTRLLVSNFLSLILLQNWKEGEKYFAQKLVDYDPCSNNMNWQFSAQVGTDRVPYLRIYNPFTQAKEFDPKCEYIKTWIPELKDTENNIILNWDKYNDQNLVKYKKPVVDYSTQIKLAKKLYK